MLVGPVGIEPTPLIWMTSMHSTPQTQNTTILQPLSGCME